MRVSSSGRRGFVYLSFVFLGVSTTVFMHSMRKDLQEYNLTIEELQLFEIVPFLPWSYKCFFAFFSENIPIFHQHQRPYLIGANFLSAVFCFFLLFPSLDKTQYLVIFFVQQNCAAWADCVLDTMKVEEATDEYREDATASGRFGTRTQMARAFGRWVGKTSGPVLWQSMTSKGVYGLLSLVYLVPMTLSFFVQEKEKFYQRRRRLKSSFGERGEEEKTNRAVCCLDALKVVWKHAQNRNLLKILLFVLGTTFFIPSPATPIFFFLNDVVGLTSFEQAVLNSTSELSQLLALLLFEKWIRKWKVSTMFIVFALLQTLSIVFNMLLVTEIPGTSCPRWVELNETTILRNDTSCYFYETYNVSAMGLAFGEWVIGDALDELQSQPLTVATSIICTGHLSGTMFTLIYALQNLVRIISQVLNSQWISLLGINHYKFENLYILISIGGAGWLFTALVGYFLLPHLKLSEMGDEQRSSAPPSSPPRFSRVRPTETSSESSVVIL